jgi:hypothetical protein
MALESAVDQVPESSVGSSCPGWLSMSGSGFESVDEEPASSIGVFCASSESSNDGEPALVPPPDGSGGSSVPSASGDLISVRVSTQ